MMGGGGGGREGAFTCAIIQSKTQPDMNTASAHTGLGCSCLMPVSTLLARGRRALAAAVLMLEDASTALDDLGAAEEPAEGSAVKIDLRKNNLRMKSELDFGQWQQHYDFGSEKRRYCFLSHFRCTKRCRFQTVEV